MQLFLTTSINFKLTSSVTNSCLGWRSRYTHRICQISKDSIPFPGTRNGVADFMMNDIGRTGD